jgi:hypothetical protein
MTLLNRLNGASSSHSPPRRVRLLNFPNEPPPIAWLPMAEGYVLTIISINRGQSRHTVALPRLVRWARYPCMTAEPRAGDMSAP